MISGAHVIVHARDAETGRVFFKDVLKLKNVDVGSGWLGLYQPKHALAHGKKKR